MIYKVIPSEKWEYEGQCVDEFVIVKPYDDPRDKGNLLFSFVGISGKLRNGCYFSAYCSYQTLSKTISNIAIAVLDKKKELKLKLRFNAGS